MSASRWACARGTTGVVFIPGCRTYVLAAGVAAALTGLLVDQGPEPLPVCHDVPLLLACLDRPRPGDANLPYRLARRDAELDEQARGHRTRTSESTSAMHEHLAALHQSVDGRSPCHEPRLLERRAWRGDVHDRQVMPVDAAARDGLAEIRHTEESHFVLLDQRQHRARALALHDVQVGVEVARPRATEYAVAALAGAEGHPDHPTGGCHGQLGDAKRIGQARSWGKRGHGAIFLPQGHGAPPCID